MLLYGFKMVASNRVKLFSHSYEEFILPLDEPARVGTGRLERPFFLAYNGLVFTLNDIPE